MKISLYSLILVQCLAVIGWAYAGDLENIIVTATRGKPEHRALPMAIRVVTREQIRQSGASELTAVLRSVSAIQVSDLYGDGSSASLGIRGFSETAQQNTLVMVDGRRLNNIDNGLLDLNSINLDSINRIEIISGSAGTLYGDKAVGGVINIITQTPANSKLTAGMEIGSYEHRKLSASLENSHTNGFYYAVNGNRQLRDNYRDHNNFRLTNLAFTAGYSHESGGLEFSIQGLDENVQTPGALYSDQLLANRRQALSGGDFVNSDTMVTSLSVQQQFLEALEFRTELTRRDKSVYGALSSAGIASEFTQDRNHMELTPRVILTDTAISALSQLILGADLLETEYNITSPFGITDDTQAQAGIYAHAIFDLGDSVVMTLGVRHGRVWNDIYVDTLAYGRSLAAGTELDDTANAWDAGISWNINSDWRVFARIDRNFRFVTADEYSAVADSNFFSNLFSAGTQTPLPVTQTGMSYESGVEWSTPVGRAAVEAYRLALDNEIVFDPLVFLNTNIGSTVRTGIVLEAEIIPVDSWKIRLSYSHIDARISSGPFDKSGLANIADHMLRLSTSYQFTNHLSGYIELNSISGRTLGGDFSGMLPPLPGHETLNMNVIYDNGPVEISFRSNNLLNRYYSDNGNAGFDYRNPLFPQAATYFPAPERNFILSLEYTR